MRLNSGGSKEPGVLSGYVRSLEPNTGLEFTNLQASLWEVYLAFGLIYVSSSSACITTEFGSHMGFPYNGKSA